MLDLLGVVNLLGIAFAGDHGFVLGVQDSLFGIL